MINTEISSHSENITDNHTSSPVDEIIETTTKFSASEHPAQHLTDSSTESIKQFYTSLLTNKVNQKTSPTINSKIYETILTSVQTSLLINQTLASITNKNENSFSSHFPYKTTSFSSNDLNSTNRQSKFLTKRLSFLFFFTQNIIFKKKGLLDFIVISNLKI